MLTFGEQFPISPHFFKLKYMDFNPTNVIFFHFIVFKIAESIIQQKFYIHSADPTHQEKAIAIKLYYGDA